MQVCDFKDSDMIYSRLVSVNIHIYALTMKIQITLRGVYFWKGNIPFKYYFLYTKEKSDSQTTYEAYINEMCY